jgi:hypothetical protein
VSLSDEVIAESPSAIERLYAIRLELIQLARPTTIRHLQIMRALIALNRRRPNLFARLPGLRAPSERLIVACLPPEHYLAIRLQRWWNALSTIAFVLVHLIIAIVVYDYVVRLNPAHPNSFSSGAFNRLLMLLADSAPLILPVLFGALGAALAGLLSVKDAWRDKLLDETAIIQAWIGLAAGCIGGLASQRMHEIA